MDWMNVIRERHSVRAYTAKRLEGEALDTLRGLVEEYNAKSGLHIQLCVDEPQAFTGLLARYGKFENVQNYIALVGPKGDMLEEQCGYYGEKLVLHAQRLGLNTCWVAASYKKSKTVAEVRPGEKLLMVISLGYGATAGAARKTKSIEELYTTNGEPPAWFLQAMEAVQLAPTAMNQQKFHFTLEAILCAPKRAAAYTPKPTSVSPAAILSWAQVKATGIGLNKMQD